jgi:hypothetical protein
MTVLLGCEESQEVCKEYRKLGHEAFSNDLDDCSGGHPEWHLKMDFFEAVKLRRWDVVITFQPCTDLTVSGAKWFQSKRLSGVQEKSIRFFFEVWKVSDLSENPIGILNGGKYIKQWFPELYQEMIDYGFPFKPNQIIQPWQFGHGITKSTCIWINPDSKIKALIPTEIVSGRDPAIWKMPPSKDRAKKRSKTFSGIAKAIASQCVLKEHDLRLQSREICR